MSTGRRALAYVKSVIGGMRVTVRDTMWLTMSAESPGSSKEVVSTKFSSVLSCIVMSIAIKNEDARILHTDK